MSASSTSTSSKSFKSSKTTGTTFQIVAKAVQFKTDLEPTLYIQQVVAMFEVTADRLSYADQTKTKLVDCTVQVVVKTANNFRLEKETQVTEHNYLSQEKEAKFQAR